MGGARWASGLLILSVLSWAEAQEGKYAIKIALTAAPMETAAAIQKLLGPRSIQLLDPAGKAVCELWFRKEIPADATPEQIKNGLTYREIKQSEIVGVVRFDQDWRDYRKQKVKAGTYTLRLGYQPMDGDHTGTSDSQDFLLLLNAAKDTSPAVMDAKALSEISSKSIGNSHPAVFMLFPVSKPAAVPKLAALPKHHWVLENSLEVTAEGKRTGTSLGFGLTLVGAAD